MIEIVHGGGRVERHELQGRQFTGNAIRPVAQGGHGILREVVAAVQNIGCVDQVVICGDEIGVGSCYKV